METHRTHPKTINSRELNSREFFYCQLLLRQQNDRQIDYTDASAP